MPLLWPPDGEGQPGPTCPPTPDLMPHFSRHHLPWPPLTASHFLQPLPRKLAPQGLRPCCGTRSAQNTFHGGSLASPSPSFKNHLLVGPSLGAPNISTPPLLLHSLLLESVRPCSYSNILYIFVLVYAGYLLERDPMGTGILLCFACFVQHVELCLPLSSCVVRKR